VRVNPDRQTLILAGETPPGRSAAATNANSSNASSLVANSTGFSSQRFTIGTPSDADITEAEFTDTVTYDAIDPAGFKMTALPAAAARQSAYGAPSMGFAFNGASAYARTQALSDRYPLIIDTYA